jgi:hypothetical protein
MRKIFILWLVMAGLGNFLSAQEIPLPEVFDGQEKTENSPVPGKVSSPLFHEEESAASTVDRTPTKQYAPWIRLAVFKSPAGRYWRLIGRQGSSAFFPILAMNPEGKMAAVMEIGVGTGQVTNKEVWKGVVTWDANNRPMWIASTNGGSSMLLASGRELTVGDIFTGGKPVWQDASLSWEEVVFTPTIQSGVHQPKLITTRNRLF